MPAQGGVTFSPTCDLDYQVRTKSGGTAHSTCDLDYQVRTKSGEGQLTAACPRRGVN